MIERTSAALIRKHGFRSWFTTVARQLQSYATPVDDKEGDLIRGLILDGESVLELGCGPQKTVPSSDGIDIVPNGQPISEFDGRTSVADIVADVTQELPVDGQYDVIVARHILEHCVDTVQTIQRWQKALKPGGRLIIAVPDELVTSGIPLNPEHCHAFTPESLQHLVEACGFAQSLSRSSGNGVSFVSSFLNLRMPSLEEEVYA
jgi:SAM-dependent methyltransferase